MGSRSQNVLKCALAAMAVCGLLAIAAALVGIAVASDGPAVGELIPMSRKVVADERQPHVTVSYRVANRGGSELIIDGVETGCGCSVASIEKRIIQPGGEGQVVIKATVPPAGERTLDMVLRTSQPPQGEYPFRLTIVGNAPIPHVAKISCVAQFGMIQDLAQTKTIFVITREREGSNMNGSLVFETNVENCDHVTIPYYFRMIDDGSPVD